MHKVCKTCGETRQLSEFPRHRNMADGHLSKCKQCVNSYVRIRRQQNPDASREYMAKYRAREHAKQARRAYQSRPEVLKAECLLKAAWAARNRVKRLAHQSVTRAVRAGRLIRLACEVCGNIKAQAHHDDYGKPLEVRWLCTAHHAEWHKENDPVVPDQSAA
jgi:hypothetical protein